MYNVIGRPVNEPKAVVVQPLSKRDMTDAERGQITEIVEKNLQNISDFCNELISGKYQIV